MVIAGIIGAGLMWGWFLVLLVDQRPVRVRTPQQSEAENSPSKLKQFLAAFIAQWQTERRPYLNLLAVAIFTSWFAWLIYHLTSVRLLIPFFVALIAAFSIHFAWRQQLRRANKRSQ